MDGVDELAARVDRLESTEAIRQLAARYAVALDSRDVAAMADLFVEDVRVGEGRTGRAELRAFFDRILRPYRLTFHLIGNHRIDFDGPDTATGIVYCRPEHEVGDLWIVMPMAYLDRYERRDGTWYFASRRPKAFYAADVLERPGGDRFHFPDNPMITRATLPEAWPTWDRFWSDAGVG
ncbi:nuclear transport factor 2 family protein [Phytohabitans sp. ZYX-F-186]|uniref:Nuclear transport factor 2 family protein n=1 Tax=Phytohabitans maris TaxID=3071409 RepID=A0ABU0ZBL4_9ACTN|nr:nuclear transport factor 2 family protein [Phytohabitans sp. ZYX-F-186]MDQ7903707.1 nuclear transport factor 2 family protein [Phytohabitans sp. ZYX-F-186]